MIRFTEDRKVTEGLRQWRGREVFETDLGSAELRGIARQIRNRCVFSARTTNGEYLADVAQIVDDILAGKIGMAEGRFRAMKRLKEIGYDPIKGFPDDFGNVPPAEKGSLQDLSSARRIDLVLETNVRMARGYGQLTGGNTPTSRFSNPAWELVRLYERETPRGTPESHSVGWGKRWADAAESVGWEGALNRPNARTPRYLALKDSPIWQALGDGDGGYTDTLLNNFPPFAFRSGFGWRAADREECIAVGLIQGDFLPDPVPATISPAAAEVKRVVDNMPEDLRAELLKELGLA